MPTNAQIVETIYRSGNYKGLCIKIAKKPVLAEELFSEFILALMEMDNSKLSKHYSEPYFDVFCVGIINNIWGKKGRVKNRVLGTTSPLFEYTSTLETDGNNYFARYSEPYNIRIDYVSKEVKDIILNDWDNPDKDKMYKARVFYYSYLDPRFKSPKEYARLSGIKYSAVIQTCVQVRNMLKKKLTPKYKND